MTDCYHCSEDDYDDVDYTHADYVCQGCGDKVCENHVAYPFDKRVLCDRCVDWWEQDEVKEETS